MNKFLLLYAALMLTAVCRASKVDTIAVYSDAMHKKIKCVVVTPDSHKKTDKRLPVIYMLHGYSGNYSQWVTVAPDNVTAADKLDVILVLPDGGYGSWYLDSPVDSSIRYETFVSKELVKYIDDNYQTAADKQHRAITGLSMGGHGALYLASRHKDVYGAAGSTSGGVDFRPFPKNWDLAKDLGSYETHQQNWDDNTVMTNVDRLQNGDVKLIIDCGVGDFFIQVNRALHQKLLEKKIDHDYIERPGEHNGQYWSNSIKYQLLFFKTYFEGK